MKKLTNLFGFLLVASSLIFFSACGDDDIVIDPGDGINVADGKYLAKVGADPVSGALLSTETVEAESFSSQARTGFTGGYIFLTAGDYNLVTVVAKEITSTQGGAATMESDEASSCDFNDYMTVSTSEGGAAFSIAADGLYRVTHDQLTNELVIYKIEKVNIIGSGTPGGWSMDTDLTGTVDASGGAWQATGVILRSGEWKIRFNCRWNLDRRVDPNAGFDEANGYQLFTNFGGTPADLQNGNDGSNMQITEDAEYTVDVTWSPNTGFSAALTRTGDAPVITFNPNDYKFGVIGDATAGSWDSDRNLFHKEEGGVHTWYGVVTFAGTGEWKLRTNDNWDDYVLGGDIAAPTTSGGNFPTPGEGAYYITLSTADEGANWSGTLSQPGWGLIGEGQPGMAWDVDTPLTADGFDGTNTVYSHTGMFTTGPWKFRAGEDWKLNIGGDLGFLTLDGGDITLSEEGMYTVTLTFDGEDYSATAEKQ